jgi:Tol biopolymer transport system component
MMSACSGATTEVWKTTKLGTGPAWTPNGGFTFAFVEFPPNADRGHLAIVRSDASSVQGLSDSLGWSPAFSPDGRRIAVGGPPTDPRYNTALWVMNVDGTGAHAIVNWSVVGELAWSPDGQHIVFTCTDSIPGYSMHLCLTSTEGGSFIRLTGREIGAAHPTWSPDGRHVAFACRPGGFIGAQPGTLTPPEPFQSANVQGICVAAADGSGWHVVASGDYGDPTWSQAANLIAFVRGYRELTIATPEGTIVRTLPTPTFSGVSVPAWSPDGKGLAFVASRDTVIGDAGVHLDFDSIYLIGAEGGALTRVTRGFDAESPAWSPVN